MAPLQGVIAVFKDLGFSDKPTAASGTTDIDLPLMTGDTDTLFAVGTAEISVVPILQLIPETEPFLVLGLSAENVLGKHAEENKYNNGCIGKGQEPIQQGNVENNIEQIIQDAQCHYQNDQSNIELVGAVAPLHKASKHRDHRLVRNDG